MASDSAAPSMRTESGTELWKSKRHWVIYKATNGYLSSARRQQDTSETITQLLTSSNSDGRIFRVCNPLVNLLKTPANPFIKDIFSSLVLDVKFERSRKLRVEMGREEKNGWEGRVAGVGRAVA